MVFYQARDGEAVVFVVARVEGAGLGGGEGEVVDEVVICGGSDGLVGIFSVGEKSWEIKYR